MATIRLNYVHAFADRYGRRRYYFRRRGKRTPLPGEPGSRVFMEAYAAALDESGPTRHSRRRQPPAAGTFAALATLYFHSPNFGKLSPTTKGNYRRIIDGFLAEHGHGRVDQFRRQHVDKIIGRMADRPGAAITLLKRIRTLVRFAIEIGWIASDPTAGVDRTTRPRSTLGPRTR